jgi:hypothetical protein
MMKNGLVLRGETGNPGDVVIDAQVQGTVIRCEDLEDTTRIEGLTFTGGENDILHGGTGGLFCYGSNVAIEYCRFADNNTTNGDAGGMQCAFSSAVLRHCTFFNNSGEYSGAFIATYSDVEFQNCTFSNNCVYVDTLGCLHLNQYDVVIDRTIIAYTANGQAVYCPLGSGSSISVSCSDLYGNASGDWYQPTWDKCIAGQGAILGNISADPMFCDTLSGDLTLDCASPCLEYISSCGRIGAHGWACGTAGVDQIPSSSRLRLMTLPNPSNRIMSISYEQPETSKGELKILDVTGRLVRKIELTAPSGQVIWDGASDHGEGEAPGVYFLRLEAGEQVVTRKAVLVK